MTKYRAKWYTGEVMSGELHDFSFSAVTEALEAQEAYEKKTGIRRGVAWESVEAPDTEEIAVMEMICEAEEPSLDLLELTSPIVTAQQDTKSVNSRNGG